MRGFLSRVVCLDIDLAVQNQAIALRRRHKIKLADSLVLATALTHHLRLITLDNSLHNKFYMKFRLPESYGVCGIGNDRVQLDLEESTPPFWAFSNPLRRIFCCLLHGGGV